MVRDLQRHLIEDRGLDKASINFTGYWKRETVDAVEGDDAVPDSENHESSFMKFHELAETLPAHAIKAAANLGIGELISRGTSTVAGMVEATGADDRALRKFLRYLEGIELLEPVGEVAAPDGSYHPEEYGLTSVGEYLANDMIVDHLKDGGVEARKGLAFAEEWSRRCVPAGRPGERRRPHLGAAPRGPQLHRQGAGVGEPFRRVRRAAAGGVAVLEWFGRDASRGPRYECHRDRRVPHRCFPRGHRGDPGSADCRRVAPQGSPDHPMKAPTSTGSPLSNGRSSRHPTRRTRCCSSGPSSRCRTPRLRWRCAGRRLP